MTQKLAPLGLAALIVLAPVAASADCLVEYKAKRDTPFTLVYDTVKLGGDCSQSAVQSQLSKKLAKQGLTLLKVVSITKR